MPRTTSPLSASSERPCATCGATNTTIGLTDHRGQLRYFWRTCACVEVEIARDAERIAAMGAARRQSEADALLGDAGMTAVASMRLDSFVPDRLGGVVNPYDQALGWLRTAFVYGPKADYRDAASPPACLYFYSGGKGRGKTHLAAGLAWETQGAGKLAAFVQEHAYLTRLWSCKFADLEQVSGLPGDRAWLTVVDDIGQRSSAGATVSDAWYSVFNQRWLKAGWTIVTSNWLPEELLQRGTINDATLSRLLQMTRGEIVYFDATDARMEGV
jgi:hypothetical protein